MEQTDNPGGAQPHEAMFAPDTAALAGIKSVMCSVLILDIVAYSRRSVSEQMELRNGLNKALDSAILLVSTDDRIILDTAAGVAISFLNNVEDALRVALMLSENLREEGAGLTHPLPVRMGIHLGPVHLILDSKRQPNIVGDGINVAQRVTEFSEAGQILISRSYRDAISNHAPEYAGMLPYHGNYIDKHLREHEVYLVSSKEDMAQPIPGKDGAEQGDRSGQDAGGNPGIIEKFSSRPLILVGAFVVGILVLVAAKLIKVGSEDAKPASAALVEPAKMAILRIAVTPWGEVYLDGSLQGISPPLAELKISPGAHHIEIRNKAFPEYSRNFKINPGENKDIRYRFADPLN